MQTNPTANLTKLNTRRLTALGLCTMLAMGILYPTDAAADKTTSILKNTKIEELSHKAKHRFAKVKGFTRRGERAQRFEIRHGDCGRTSGWNDCNNDRARVERKERPKNVFSKPGKAVWYGYSIFVPKDFVSLGRSTTTLSQAKVEGELFPMWLTAFSDNPYILFSGGSTCNLPKLSTWRGRWSDITVYANYAERGARVYFQFFRNGKLLCEHRKPLIPASKQGKKQKIGFKYGIYNSWVSRYLAANATKPIPNQGFAQKNSTGTTSKSASATPFKVDWGVKLPTHVIFYDEMLAGTRREDVDVRMREQRGLPPVD